MKTFLKISMVVATVVTFYSCNENDQKQAVEQEKVETAAPKENTGDSTSARTEGDTGVVVKEEVKK